MPVAKSAGLLSRHDKACLSNPCDILWQLKSLFLVETFSFFRFPLLDADILFFIFTFKGSRGIKCYIC